MIFAALGTAIGLPMGLVGSQRMRRWIHGEQLDRFSADQLRTFTESQRLRASRGSRLRLRVGPIFRASGGGLALALEF